MRGGESVGGGAEGRVPHDGDAVGGAVGDHLLLLEVGVELDLVDGRRDRRDRAQVIQLRLRKNPNEVRADSLRLLVAARLEALVLGLGEIEGDARTVVKFETPILRTWPRLTNFSMTFHVCVYSILIDQIGLGEPSGRRSGWGVPGGFSSFFSPKAKGQWIKKRSR